MGSGHEHSLQNSLKTKTTFILVYPFTKTSPVQTNALFTSVEGNYLQLCLINKSDYTIIMKTSTPTKAENLKLKQKSEVITSVTHASKRSFLLGSCQPVKYLNLDYFKLHPCSNPQSHTHKLCPNYHNAKDRKRYGAFYSDNMCEYISHGEKCPRGDQCTESHSRVEQLYQYQTYKKKFCSHYPKNIHKCQYKEFCSFAHSEAQIRCELIHNYEYDEDFYMFHYKTQFCPFNLTQHDKALCVYAHNLQDYRRNPSFYSYEPIACFNWKLKDYIYNYELGCQNGLNCNMCHGWKQLQYHPNAYRTSKCLEPKCRKGQCPNYHTEKERRNVEDDVANRCFKYVARNRIVEGVFKPEAEESFQPRQEIKMKSVISKKSSEWNNSDFSVKTVVQGKDETSEKNSYKQKQQPRYFLDQEPVGSEEENESDDSEVQNQVDKIMNGE